MGESYAAHYVPAIGAQIVRDNQKGRIIKLASIAVGNGLFDMRAQYQYLPEMACHSTYAPIVNSTTCNAMIDARSTFTRMMTAKSHSAANLTFAGYDILTPYQVAGGNPYDVRTLCNGGSLCDPYMDTISQFARQPWVRTALGTRSDFQLCNPNVQNAFINAGDEIIDASQWIPEILAHGVRVLNYAGDADLICNWMGNRELMMRMPWPGQTGFNMARDRVWTGGGVVRVFAGLTVLRVEGAGHMVAKDQPERALHMVSQWLNYGAILEQELRLSANQYSTELKHIASKIGELESELTEHHLVIETIQKVPKTRKCFRLVNGVLIERTVSEVLPALKTNEEGIKSTIKHLTEQYKAKDKEFMEFQQTHGIRIASAS
ncbi:hypothetical protein EV180_002490 [Coemansia sp. RSA 518]|nr:hypothetical protein EV180_002490 [Coemansia sp. RSA 518]